jgi:SpoIID/LytB domain protein
VCQGKDQVPAPVTIKPRARVRALLVATLLLVSTGGTLLVGVSPAAAYPTPNVELDGHGFGHGRGMGQYGALGYALNFGWNYRQILAHYYSNTAVGDIGNPEITTILRANDQAFTVVQQERGHMTTNSAHGTFTALRARKVGTNQFQVDSAPSCAGPWTRIHDGLPGPVVFYPQLRNDDRAEMIQVCEPSGTRRWYRGEIRAVEGLDGTQRTVNATDMQSYLRGVVPRESPASWADLGAGAGLQALKAQAVAARSYAQASSLAPYAKTCDTTACQVYGGRALDNGTFVDLEDARTDRAVAETLGEVRTIDGAPARTEYSSSTGGYTAGPTFPPVPDEGDAVAINPFHNWHASIPVGRVQAAYPSIGTLNAVVVTRRNGLGDFGGRVLEMQLQGTQNTVTVSGDNFASALELRSNWFAVAAPPRGPGSGPIAIRGEQVANSRPDTASVRGTERVDVVTRSSSSLAWTFWTGSQWAGWVSLGAPPTGAQSDPTIVSWAPGRLDVFVRGGDNRLWQTFSENGGANWSGWIKPLGDEGTLASGPQASSRGPGRLDIWVTGTDNQLYQRFYEGQWNAGGWLSQGRPPAGINGEPTAASQDGVRVDLFVRGGDDKLWRRSWDGAAWSAWNQPVGASGVLSSSPDVASWGSGNLMVFVRGSDSGVYGLVLSGGVWSSWTRMAAPETATPDAPGVSSRGVNRYDIFVRGTDNRVYQIWQ